MAEIKNTFIKSKMNKDLDDRIVPKGEYRDALNIGISQTESDDVGALHVVLGNEGVKELNTYIASYSNVRAIGAHPDNNSQKIYIFLTNFLDSTSTSINQTFSIGTDVVSMIVEYDTVSNTFVTLVSGSFLNFSLNARIDNIDIIEDLLFWTDNRNQPRKINIQKARSNPGYYWNEDLISVAKYYPWQEIQLVQNEITSLFIVYGGSGTVVTPIDFEVGQVFNTTPNLTVGGSGLTVEITSIDPLTGNITSVKIVNPGQDYKNGDIVKIESNLSFPYPSISIATAKTSTMRDTCTPYLPPSGVSISTDNPAVGPIELEQVQVTDPIPLFEEISGGVYPYTVLGNELWVYNADNPGTGWTVVETLNVNGSGNYTFLADDHVNLGWTVVGQTFYFAQANPYYNSTFPGDCEYLKDRFVRFAYRFKYTDNEYSLISPFTQPIFQPQQYGYFTYPQEENTYTNTEVSFAQNRITEVDLLIPCPNFLQGNQTWNNASISAGIESVQIIYKDDNEATLKILNEITKERFGTSRSLKFTYQSTTPFRVLPESELVRTSDIVPIKALTQSVSGNRVIYGNYLNRHSSIRSLNYRVGTRNKSTESTLKYSNHNLKQNRTYQVGFVMADRYGRKSDVILSDLDFSSFIDSSGISYGASTVYNPYGADLISSVPSTTWPGDQISVFIQSPFPDSGPLGYPGLFKSYNKQENQIQLLFGGNPGDYSGASVPQVFDVLGGSGTGMQIQAFANPADGTISIGAVDYATWPSTGIGLPLIINQGTGYTNGDILTVESNITPATGSATFVLNIAGQPNLLGFNSFQVVVKQQEQEYYNVYLPGIVNGEINTTSSTVSNNRAVISLFSDNINKVPKDLEDVGPSQTNYNSDAKLFLRVENTLSGNRQFPTVKESQSVTQISELSDVGINLVRTSLTVYDPIGIGGDSYDFTSFSEDNIGPGSSVTVVDGTTGNVRIGLNEGIYVASYNETTSINGSTVVLNEDISPLYTVVPGDVFIFGPSGVIFNAGNNPLIGMLSTTEDIGVSEDEGFKPFLSVFETTPTFSNLDIFWETSTTGLISDINSKIINGTVDELLPTTISDIYFDLNEDECESGSVVTASNYFWPLDNINQAIIDVNTTCVLESVVDGNNNPVSGFTIDADPTGRFRLASEGDRYCGGDNDAYQYIFSIKIVAQGTTLLKTATGSLSNQKPALDQTVRPNSGIRYLDQQSKRAFANSFNLLVTSNSDGLNGALGSSVDEFEVTKELISATIESFDDDPRLSFPCECLTATQKDNNNANDTGLLNLDDSGLFEGMDVSGLFQWGPPSSNRVFNGTTNPSYNQVTCHNTQRPIAPSSSTPLWFLGFPTSNGPRTRGFGNQSLNYFRLNSTSKRCTNIEIKIVLKITDGPGTTYTETFYITPTKVI